MNKGFLSVPLLFLLAVLTLSAVIATFYFINANKESAISTPKRPSSSQNCLELQKEHTHEKSSPGSFGFFNSGMPLPEYEVNECERKASSSNDIEEIKYLSQSEDPLVIIRLAQNPSIPVETQWKLYEEVELKYEWRDLAPFESIFTSFENPQQALRIYLLKNINLDPKIAENVLMRYSENDPKFTKQEIFAMLGDGYSDTQHSNIKNLYLKIAKLNQIDFNRIIAMIEGLDEDTINYLGQDISYDIDENSGVSYDKSSPNFRNYPSPNFEVHSMLLKNNVASKPIILAHLRETRDYQRIEISPKNLSIISEEILSDEMRDYFFASTASGKGVSSGRYTYAFHFLFHGIGLNEFSSKETLQALLDKYSNPAIDQLLNKQLDSISNMQAIDLELQEKYPDWPADDIPALRNALTSAKQNLMKRN